MALEFVPDSIVDFLGSTFRFIRKADSQRSDILINRTDDICECTSNKLPPFLAQAMAVVRKLTSGLINRLLGTDDCTDLADLLRV